MRRLVIRHGPVLRGRRLVLEPGVVDVPLPAAVGVVGINGSGKSSLFMALAGVLRHRRVATVTVGGAAGSIAWAPQTPALPDWLSVEDVARLYGVRFADLQAAMPGLHLKELAGQRASVLSVGQRQALCLALALGLNAALTLLDEPFSALDFRRRLGALSLLAEWHRKHPERALFMSSQTSTDLLNLCDHFIVLRSGRYAFNGPARELAAGGRDSALEDRLLHLLT